MSTWNTLTMQDANSTIMEQMIFFHDHAMMIIFMIMISISYLLLTLMTNSFNNKFIMHQQSIEIIWTIIPMILLIFLAMPSLKILYLTDELENPILTIKSIGHQWYWSYEYSDFMNIQFDSFMMNFNSKINNNKFRLLDVDMPMIIPYKTTMRILISSMDVIHSWTIPSLGIKIDAIPGRMNQILLLSNYPSIMYGQCSEICGMNHSFMPIMIESTSQKEFMNWLNKM